MATLKRRLNISLAPDMERAISRIAKRDNIPQATKAAELLASALELEEDIVLESFAISRDKKAGKLVPHALAWK